MKRPTRARLFERRRDVANSALTGGTQAAIARHMRIPQAPRPARSVSRDLAALREFWREFPVFDFPRFLEPTGGFVMRGACDDVVAPEGPFCATRRFVPEFCVSPPRVRAFSDLRTIASDGVVPGEPRECGDLSAGPDWGSGEDRWLAVMLRSFEKLRISAMRDR